MTMRAAAPDITSKIINLRDAETAACARLDPVYYDYFASGAQDEVTVAANEAAFRRRALVPRVLRGCGPPRLATTVLGQETSMPVLLAPTAFHRLAWREAEGRPRWRRRARRPPPT
jgi:4-hydroxymandelate oxidase